MKGIRLKKTFMLFGMVYCCMVTQAIGGDGCYFIQTFEDASQMPTEKVSSEQVFNIDGQGEWIYFASFQASNTSYIPDGSEHGLRLPKNGSYVVTPLLSSGVFSVSFDIGRATVKVYTSTDGGKTWTEATQTVNGKKVKITVSSETVNRIKIGNDASKDADIDNLAIYAQTFKTPVTVATGEATEITVSSATLSGQITKNEGETVTEVGFVWSTITKEPTLSDNVTSTQTVEDNFSV